MGCTGPGGVPDSGLVGKEKHSTGHPMYTCTWEGGEYSNHMSDEIEIVLTRDDVYETLCPQHMFVHKDGQIYKVKFIHSSEKYILSLLCIYMYIFFLKVIKYSIHPLSADQILSP